MNKSAIFSHYTKIIDKMIDNSLFFKTYWQLPHAVDCLYGLENDNAFPDNLAIRFGVSRGCIIDDNYDYVVKFDIAHDTFGDSMCEREIDIFRAARANDLDAYFTEPIYLGAYERTINFYDADVIGDYLDWYDYSPERFDKQFMDDEENFGSIHPIQIYVPLYAYPRAESYVYTMLDDGEVKTYREQACLVNSPLKKRHLQIAMEFVFRYGMSQYEKLSDFMNDYGINDLHYGNLGQVNGHLCIIDFAGYHNEYSSSSDYGYDDDGQRIIFSGNYT